MCSRWCCPTERRASKVNAVELSDEYLQEVINRYGYKSGYLRLDVELEAKRRGIEPQGTSERKN